MKTAAIRFRQGNHTLYLTALPASWLKELGPDGNVNVDWWEKPGVPETDPDKLLLTGYQRKPSAAHYRKIHSYLRDFREDALLPTTVLLNSRTDKQELLFNPAEGDSDLGHLVIRPESLPLMIVDGQHRILGLKHAVEEEENAGYGEMMVPVTVVDGLDKAMEIAQFHVINRSAKKVSTDLSARHLNVLARKDKRFMRRLTEEKGVWETRAVNIVDILVTLPGSVWKDRIRFPNDPPMKGRAASQGMLVNSLKELVGFMGKLQHPDETIAAFVNDLWKAIRLLMPEPFEEPRQYVVQKSSGVWPVHLIAPSLYAECYRNNAFSVDDIATILERSATYFKDPSYWDSKNTDGAALYTSQKAFRLLADAMLSELNLQ